MTTSRITNEIIDLTKYVTIQGKSHIAYDGLRIFQHSDRLLQFITGNNHAINPVTVELWPSLSCNARCPLCPNRLSGARDEADSTNELKLFKLNDCKRIVHELKEAKVKSIILTGGGEPLLHPQIVQITQIINNYSLKWALFTNGLLLTPKLAKELFLRNPDFFRISLDAGTAEQYSKTYLLEESEFKTVSENIINAAIVAKSISYTGFGVGFTLSANLPDTEITAIYKKLDYLIDKSQGGISFISFRPRLAHFKDNYPLVPQPHASFFPELADKINSKIILPLKLKYGNNINLDIKEGLFIQAAKLELNNSSLSSPWMTNIDHTGKGYSITELTGTNNTAITWGHLTEQNSFQNEWGSSSRKNILQLLADGLTRTPIVHRTSSLDFILLNLKKIIQDKVEKELALEIINKLKYTEFYRTKNPDFV